MRWVVDETPMRRGLWVWERDCLLGLAWEPWLGREAAVVLEVTFYSCPGMLR